MATKPEKYNMMQKPDRDRWFREMEGYFRTSNFRFQGTDIEGRQFALDGFEQLKNIIALDYPLLDEVRKLRLIVDELKNQLVENTKFLMFVEHIYHHSDEDMPLEDWVKCKICDKTFKQITGCKYKDD